MAEQQEGDAADAGVAVQLIDGEGEFASEGAERFMAAAGVAGCGLSYAVVSIMGPQSSGTCTHRAPSFVSDRPRSIDDDRSIGSVSCWSSRLVRRSRSADYWPRARAPATCSTKCW
jgi:hypothetical protein